MWKMLNEFTLESYPSAFNMNMRSFGNHLQLNKDIYGRLLDKLTENVSYSVRCAQRLFNSMWLFCSTYFPLFFEGLRKGENEFYANNWLASTLFCVQAEFKFRNIRCCLLFYGSSWYKLQCAGIRRLEFLYNDLKCQRSDLLSWNNLLLDNH